MAVQVEIELRVQYRQGNGEWKTLNTDDELSLVVAGPLVDALKAVEWEQAGGAGNDDLYCPWCGHNFDKGHAKDCLRQIALNEVQA